MWVDTITKEKEKAAENDESESLSPYVRQMSAPLEALKKRVQNYWEDGQILVAHAFEDLSGSWSQKMTSTIMELEDLQFRIADPQQPRVDRRSIRLVFETQMWQALCLFAFSWGICLGRAAIFNAIRQYVVEDWWFFTSLELFFIPFNTYLYNAKHIIGEEARRYILFTAFMTMGLLEGLHQLPVVGSLSRHPPPLVVPMSIALMVYKYGELMGESRSKFASAGAFVCFFTQIAWALFTSTLTISCFVITVFEAYGTFLSVFLMLEFFASGNTDMPVPQTIFGCLVGVYFHSFKINFL